MKKPTNKGKIIMNLNNFGNPDPNWNYYNIWKLIISLSQEIDELGLYLCEEELLNPEAVGVIELKLKKINTKTLEALTIAGSLNNLLNDCVVV